LNSKQAEQNPGGCQGLAPTGQAPGLLGTWQPAVEASSLGFASASQLAAHKVGWCSTFSSSTMCEE